MKRILSIDGGGIRGIIPAFVCCEIEQFCNKPLWELFDMIAGTSTGGIIALGLSRSLSAKKLLDLYCERGCEIFIKPKRSLTQYFRPKYEVGGLEKLLTEFFSNKRLSDALVKTMVTSYDIGNRIPVIIKSWDVQPSSEEDFLLRDVARATSAAPTFFKPTRNLSNLTAIDGGIYCNNPALLAYIEGKKMWPDDRICLISLGTGELTTSILFSDAEHWGKVKWAHPVIDCAHDGICKSTHNALLELSGFEEGRLQYYRLQSPLDQTCEKMDDCSITATENLKRIGKNLVDNSKNTIVSIFGVNCQAAIKKAKEYITAKIDENSKYIRYETRDIIKEYLRNKGIPIEHINLCEGLTINDLVNFCKVVYPNHNDNDILNWVKEARSYAFTIKYSDPVEDEKLISVDKLKLDDLKPWTTYFQEILNENDINLKKLRVLDVGAGHGQANFELYELCRNIRLIDASSKALNNAKAKLPNAEIFNANAEYLSHITTASVDVYLSFRTFQSILFDIRAALHQAARILDYKGIFIISVPIMFAKQDGTILKGLLRYDSKTPELDYAMEIVNKIKNTAEILQFKNLKVDDRSPFEIYIIGEK